MKIKILFAGDINSTHLQKWIRAFYSKFDIAVFSLDPISDRCTLDSEVLNAIRVVTPEKKNTDRKAKFSYLFQQKVLRKLNREFAPDIVHAHYASSYGFLASRLRVKRFYVSVWGSDVFEFPKRSIIHKAVFKHVMRKADQIFSTSKVMKDEILKYVSKEITVIPFGVDLELFKPLNEKRDKLFVIGTVKALEHVYGIDRLIEVFASFIKRYSDAECHIYGAGSELKKLEILANNLGVSNNIKFFGVIPQNQVPRAIASMDVFCVLSREESFGVAAVEAAACKVPVIASNVGGLPEVVSNNETGYLVDGDNSEQIKEVIIDLYNNPEKRRELGEKGRVLVEQQYDWKRNVLQMEKYYTQK